MVEQNLDTYSDFFVKVDFEIWEAGAMADSLVQ